VGDVRNVVFDLFAILALAEREPESLVQSLAFRCLGGWSSALTGLG